MSWRRKNYFKRKWFKSFVLLTHRVEISTASWHPGWQEDLVDPPKIMFLVTYLHIPKKMEKISYLPSDKYSGVDWFEYRYEVMYLGLNPRQGKQYMWLTTIARPRWEMVGIACFPPFLFINFKGSSYFKLWIFLFVSIYPQKVALRRLGRLDHFLDSAC